MSFFTREQWLSIVDSAVRRAYAKHEMVPTDAYIAETQVEVLRKVFGADTGSPLTPCANP